MAIEPTELFDTCGIDFIGPLPEGTHGEKYIITAVNHITIWPLTRAVEYAYARTAAKFIYEEIFCT